MIITDENLLRTPCEIVRNDEIGPLIDQLERELKHSEDIGRKGIGLAASQIAIFKRACIVRVTPELSVNLVNARIEKGYDKATFQGEGCLSYPDRYEATERYQEIYVVDNAVEPYRFVCTGLMAVVVAHELDHTNGVLLPDVAIKKPKIVMTSKLKPNDKCLCGSNLKFKKCCGKV